MILKRLFCANKEWSTAKNYQIGLVKGTLYRKTQEKGPEPIFRKYFMLAYLPLCIVIFKKAHTKPCSSWLHASFETFLSPNCPVV